MKTIKKFNPTIFDYNFEYSSRSKMVKRTPDDIIFINVFNGKLDILEYNLDELPFLSNNIFSFENCWIIKEKLEIGIVINSFTMYIIKIPQK